MEALTFSAAAFFQSSQQDDKLTSHLLTHHSPTSLPSLSWTKHKPKLGTGGARVEKG